ncbi:MAG: hypothetical protein K8T20_18335 [Planctomycetes bacterium]|nr:hypothetical protein [Planctomycetota bacterium]
MNEAEFEALLSLALKELEDRQALLPPPEEGGSWNGSQVTGEFALTDSQGRTSLTARMQFVGTWSSASGSWFWAWADETLDPAVCESVEEVRAFGHKQRVAALTSERMPCSEEDAVRLFAIALHIMKAEAPYRYAMSPTSTAYVALFDIKNVI